MGLGGVQITIVGEVMLGAPNCGKARLFRHPGLVAKHAYNPVPGSVLSRIEKWIEAKSHTVLVVKKSAVTISAKSSVTQNVGSMGLFITARIHQSTSIGSALRRIIIISTMLNFETVPKRVTPNSSA